MRGRRLSELRGDVQIARARAYGIFNEINSSDDFDVYCHDESRSGTRVPHRFAARDSRTASRHARRKTISPR